MARHPRLVTRTLAAAWAVVLALAGCSPTPAGPAEGAGARGTARPSLATTAPVRLRIATFNIHSGEGRDGREDLGRVARLLEGFHVVGLNEVRGAAEENQAARLGRATDMAWLFAPVERGPMRGAFGNGLLTALPVRHWQRLPISIDEADSNRNVLLVRIPYRDQTLNVIVTHLGRRPADRPRQLRAVGELFLALQPPAILMGDLNTTRDDEHLRGLVAEPGVASVPDEGRDPGTESIDWILMRGLRVVDSGMVDEGASDHPLVWAELELLADDAR